MKSSVRKSSSQEILFKHHKVATPSSDNFQECTRALPAESELIQRKSMCACGGGCPNCQPPFPIQAKLKIGEPNDKYEQEANRVADQVMRMPDTLIHPTPT